MIDINSPILKTFVAIAENLDLIWTFILHVVRFAAMMMFLPGLGMGMMGALIRMPAILAMALACTSTALIAPIPTDFIHVIMALGSELLFGSLIGLIPLMIVSGAQMAGQLAAGTMGLSAANLIDPTMGGSAGPLSLLLGNLMIVIFLLIGGHHVAIYVASGLGGQFAPGNLIPATLSAELLVDRSAHIFEAGVVMSAPVIVALLLTQFVMGLISKAVPTVNIFIISFPLTIGIGLVLISMSLPAIVVSATHEFAGIENSLMVVAKALMQS